MKVLVTGASGFIGRNLCLELKRQRHDIVASVRTANVDIDRVAQTVVIASIDADTDWTSALQDVDVVVHLAARVHVMKEVVIDPLAEFRNVNVKGTLNLAMQASKMRVKRLIFISSIGVNGSATVLDCPFSAEDSPNPHDAYTLSKYEAELGLQKLAAATGLEVVIIRPPLVYGYGAPGNFDRIIFALMKHYPLPFGAIKNKRSFVYVGNLINLILICLNHPNAVNQVFLVSDKQDLSTTELLRAIAGALGVKAMLLPIPQKIIEFVAKLLGRSDIARRLCDNLQVDIAKTKTLLGWEPPFTVEEGLQATALGLIEVEKQ